MAGRWMDLDPSDPNAELELAHASRRACGMADLDAQEKLVLS